MQRGIAVRVLEEVWQLKVRNGESMRLALGHLAGAARVRPVGGTDTPVLVDWRTSRVFGNLNDPYFAVAEDDPRVFLCQFDPYGERLERFSMPLYGGGAQPVELFYTALKGSDWNTRPLRRPTAIP
jgi:hypothetical protein